MIKFVFSPSNMSNYKTCPRKFQAQSITKEIQWQASKQKSRGSLVHSVLDKAVAHGMQSVTTWPEGVDVIYTTQQVNDVRKAVVDGAQMYIEHELVISDVFQKTGWWDDNALLRAKADLLILPVMSDEPVPEINIPFIPQPKVNLPAEVIDFKTGKIWDTNDYQLRIEALLVHLIYHRPVVNYSYWYVDQGETVDGSIDFRNGLSPVQDVIDDIKEIKLAIRDNYFPPKKNAFCKWRTGQCQLYGKCGI